MLIEVNGFDESGIIGENLRFIRVGIDINYQLRPLIYNLLHFGSLVVTKKMLKGQHSDVQKAYVRAVLNDPAIDINHYAFQPLVQLDILRHFTICELNRVADRRKDLINALNSPNLKNTVSDVLNYLRRYVDAWGYTERFIKSYAYMKIVEDLKKTSKVLSGRFINNHLVFILVDGGYPLVFWRDNLLKSADIMGPSVFSKEKTPIFGISNGDEYYPIISLAGNIATITNRFYEMIYPQSVKEISRPSTDFSLEEYCKDYEKSFERPKFLPRILFIGYIDRNLQYLIPFLHYEKTGNLCEPFRVLYSERGSLRSFYKRFRGDSRRDIVVCGKIRKENPKEVSMLEECKSFRLKVVNAENFFSDFKDLLSRINEEAQGSNIDRLSLAKISIKLDKTKEIVQRSLRR